MRLLTWMRAGPLLLLAGAVPGLSGCLTPAGGDMPTTPVAEARYRPPARPQAASDPRAANKFDVVPASWQQPAGSLPDPAPKPSGAAPVPPRPAGQLEVPPGLPGAEAQLPKLPPDRPETRAERLKAIEALFPGLPDLGPDPLVDGAPGAKPVTLEELLDYARRNSPQIAQAAAEVESARGRFIQAGLYPNPNVGYQADQVANLGTAGQQGGYIEQPIVINGRLRLARGVAHVDFINAQLRLRRTEVEVARQVRANYFAALVAAEQVRVTRLASEFTEQVYQRQVAMLRGGQSAAFEVAALEAVVEQTRTSLIQSRNRYVSAWKQLAASANAPDMPPAPLAGRVDAPLPRYRYDVLRDRLLAVHTDLRIARNDIAQAETALTQAQRVPIPDLQNHFYFQNDNQANSFQMGISLGAPIPVWNRNQGGILSARAEIARRLREPERVRNDLIRQLADAFERYENGRQLLGRYRDRILPKLVVAFRGVYERYQVEPGLVNYNDIVTAQQNLVTQLNNYLYQLQQQWQALADIAGIVQANDLYELAQELERTFPDTWPDAAPGVAPGQPLPTPRPIPDNPKK